MAVIIVRKTGFLGPWGRISLVLEEEISQIANNQTLALEVQKQPAFLAVKGDPKSAILVKDHQKYILSTHPHFQLAYGLACSLILLEVLTDFLPFKWILLFLAISLLVLTHLFIPRYCFKAFVGPKIKIEKFC